MHASQAQSKPVKKKRKTWPVVKWLGNGIWIFACITYLVFLNIGMVKSLHLDLYTLITTKGENDNLVMWSMSVFIALVVCLDIFYWRKLVRAIRRNRAIKWS